MEQQKLTLVLNQTISLILSKTTSVIISEVMPELLSFTQFSVLPMSSLLEKLGSLSPRGLHLYFIAQKANIFFINPWQVKENTFVSILSSLIF